MIVTPLILPLLIWGAVAIAGGLTVAGITGVFDDPKKNKLGILGMQQAGKTRFLSFLRGIPFNDKQTSRKKYDEFTYILENKKKIFIKSGVDIGGGKVHRPDYNKIIDESDVLLYFFDIDKYLNNTKDYDGEFYQRSCNSRFEHIYDRAKTRNITILVIATHKDKCSFNENEIRMKFDNLVQNKSYKEILKDVQYISLISSSETKKLANKIFNTK